MAAASQSPHRGSRAASDRRRSVSRGGTLRDWRAAASYVVARARIARAYDATPLDDLLRRIDAPRSTGGRAPTLEAIRLGERAARLARVGPDTCLFRALARYAVFRRAGRDVRFVMGVDENDGTRGHAWIELDGRAVLEGELRSYRPTLEHPPRP